MSDIFNQEHMLDMYIFETTQLIEQLEQIIINSEMSGFTEADINEIFRIMHTIKGSSAMMCFDNIAALAHSIEDLFYFLRESKNGKIDLVGLSDIVFDGMDFIRKEVEKVTSKKEPDADASGLIMNIQNFLNNLKSDFEIEGKDSSSTKAEIKSNALENVDNTKGAMEDLKENYKAIVFFEEGCEMEDMRAFGLVHSLNELGEVTRHIPEMLFEDNSSLEYIRKNGFQVFFYSHSNVEDIRKVFKETALLREFHLEEIDVKKQFQPASEKVEGNIEKNHSKEMSLQDKNSKPSEKNMQTFSPQQNIISVNVGKLDKLMDLVGELVISETMVIQNPDLEGLKLDSFNKAARRLEKITGELQDIVMSIRMVPLAVTFQKMNRIVRDMSKKLSKEVRLKIIGENTEVDKNIIEHISDPLMHIIRNSIDHGLESPEERRKKGKTEVGTVTLEAKSESGEVHIIVRDDGKGLNREKILAKARKNKLITKPESEISDKEVYSYIFLPGFSTKEEVTEFSGRGVGLDVVARNISLIGGNISVDSIPDQGTSITLKIPLTLAIMDGMTIRVGKSTYTIPMNSIKESFRPKERDIITDPDGNEMIMIRGQCYHIIRLHELYKVKTEITKLTEGIIIMVINEGGAVCLFADELLGQRQVVIKTLPEYIRRFNKARGLSGCTLLGDGSVSLILDVGTLIDG